MKSLVAAGLLAAGTAQAMTGNEFIALTDLSPVEAVRYLTGVYDGFVIVGGVVDFAGEQRAVKAIGLCFPTGVTVGQMRDVLLADLRAEPQTRHQPAAMLAYFAFRKAWPCPIAK